MDQSEGPFVNSFLILTTLVQAVPRLCVNVLGGGVSGIPFFDFVTAMVH